MRKNSRAHKILIAGTSSMDNVQLTHENMCMLTAIAAMIDYATAKPKKKEKPPLLYTEHNVLEAFPVKLQVAKHGGLNRQLRTMTLLETDLDQFTAWFRDIMLPWFEAKGATESITYSMLTKKFPEWIEKSRQYKGTTAESVTEGWR